MTAELAEQYAEAVDREVEALLPVALPCCDGPCSCERVIESVAELRRQDIDAVILWLRDSTSTDRPAWVFGHRLLWASVRQQAVLLGVFDCQCLGAGCWRCR